MEMISILCMLALVLSAQLQGMHSQIPVNAATNDCNYLPERDTHTGTHTRTHTHTNTRTDTHMHCWKSYCVLPANGFARLFFGQITCQSCGREGLQRKGGGGGGCSGENAPAKHVRYMRTCYFLPSWGPSEFWQLVIGSSPAVRCLFPNPPLPSFTLCAGESKKNWEDCVYAACASKRGKGGICSSWAKYFGSKVFRLFSVHINLAPTVVVAQLVHNLRHSWAQRNASCKAASSSPSPLPSFSLCLSVSCWRSLVKIGAKLCGFSAR